MTVTDLETPDSVMFTAADTVIRMVLGWRVAHRTSHCVGEEKGS